MSNTGKQSPLGVNVMSGLLQGNGFWINGTAAGYMGSSTSISNYTNGSISSLSKLTDSIRQGWVQYNAGNLTSTTYNNLIAMGSTTIPALGNTKPSNYNYSGYPGWGTAYSGETASYGFVRLYAWQAYNEFNYNDTLNLTGYYTDFLGSWTEASSFIDYSNQSIMALQNSFTFLEGTYSNMNDLITGDITGISLSTRVFGQDLIALGKAINLSKTRTFGFPSNVLETLKTYNALTESVVLALMASGLTNAEVEQVSNNVNVTTSQQQKIYAAFNIISGVDLESILVSLNCKTQGLETLADLLNIKKLFPNSYETLTVPIYNAQPGLPTNSKTYYPIFSYQIISPPVIAAVGSVIPPGMPTVDIGSGYESYQDGGIGIGDYGGFTGDDSGGFTGDSGGGGGGGGGKIICTKLYELGLMSKEIYLADQAFGAELIKSHPDIYNGYRAWAEIVVDWMDGRGPKMMPWLSDEAFGQAAKSWSIRWAQDIATPWAEEMAYQMKESMLPNNTGKAIMAIGTPICKIVGVWQRVFGPSNKPAGFGKGLMMIPVFVLLKLVAKLGRLIEGRK